MSVNKKIGEVTEMIGNIYEELNSFGLERYKPYSGCNDSDDWKEMSKQFEKIFARLRTLDKKTKK